MIEIRNLTKSYAASRALDGIDLDIPSGEIIGLFGENGAGKTTLIKCVFNFLHYGGTITLDGKPITRENISRLSFATCEHSFFPNMTPFAHMEFYKSMFPRFSEKRYKGLMEFFGLKEHAPVGNFSTGQKNQFEVIMALSQGADYIFMDEPFSGNDIFNREDFYKVLLGILDDNETVILSTHLIEEVSGFINRAVLIKNGKKIGDKNVSELEESTDLMSYIKKTYGYRADRVSKALDNITGNKFER